MATYLYRLGRFSYRRRALVLTMWLALIAALGVGAATLSGPTSDVFNVPGTEAQQAQDLLTERFPQAGAGGAQARVVFAAPAGEKLTDAGNRAAIGRTVAGLKAGGQVVDVTDPLKGGINPAGTVAYAQVSYKVQAVELTDADRESLAHAAQLGRDAGLTVETGGDALEEQAEQGLAEVLGFLVAAVVLLITFGSLVAAGLPLLTAILGVGAAMSGIMIVSGYTELSSSTPTLALMLGLAVAIDYALFIVSRYRHEIARGRTGIEAAGQAVGTAGSAVTFAGLTVVIALSALSVVNMPVLTQMGLGAAGAVVVAVLIALTLLPALLGFAGARITGKGKRSRDPEAEGARPTAGRRWAGLVTRRPALTLLAGTLGLLVVALPALDLRLGLPGDNMLSPETTQRKAYDLLTEGFGPGFNGPLMIVVDASGSSDPKAAAEQAAGTIKSLKDVVAVSPAAFNPAGDTAILQVIPSSAPDSQATTDLVHAIRDRDADVRGSTGADLSVTGLTAVNIDMSARMGSALVPYLAVIVVLAFLLLTLLFRSLLVPIKAIVGFLLSVGATFGAVVAVFQWGWLADVLGVEQTGPVVSLLPVILIGIVFGLAMDYEVFLVSRMREEHVHGAAPKDAVVNGFSHSARVVTAAAIIMISVFSGFILSPESIIKSIGFALAAAILFDAFVVRMTLVPAVMTLLGRRAWALPAWLDRILPDIDVEGEKLRPEAEPDTAPDDAELVGAGR
ncbi:membrane protein [Actinoplanes sp. NBRC 14428]|uniref:RND superfamily putative drug exporter n=1 Tax=Pseudosporangium ferrugineum TaxID=439699 RepID=A0A2T0SJG4_9ACTN|nr:MMPL family transporter [Pseudosporangium ferrugineum]PRY33556.1 RND superfamily putative drug exporter [Pseudosporangium ferrugineum]BCJ56494.1 membrane protein [Actinoplanes sp. NBRC 14428]